MEFVEIFGLLGFFALCQGAVVLRHGHLANKGELEPDAKKSAVGSYLVWAFVSAAISVICVSATGWSLDSTQNDTLVNTMSDALNADAGLEYTQARLDEAADKKTANVPHAGDLDARIRTLQKTADNLLKADASLHLALKSLVDTYRVLRLSDSLEQYLGNLFLVMGGGISAGFFAMALDAQRRRAAYQRSEKRPARRGGKSR